MDKKKFIIASIVAALVAIGGVIFFLMLGGEETKTPPPNSNFSESLDPEMTDSDKNAVQSIVNTYFDNIATYGWSEEAILNPVNANAVSNGDNINAIFNNIQHSTANDRIAIYKKISGSTKFSALVDKAAYSTPFSVTTTHEEINIPNEAVVENNFKTVSIAVPVKTRLAFIGTAPGYMGDDDKPVYPAPEYNILEFEGTVELNLSQRGADWELASVEDDIKVFNAGDFMFMNGYFESNYAQPVSYKKYQAQINGELKEVADLLPEFEKKQEGRKELANE